MPPPPAPDRSPSLELPADFQELYRRELDYVYRSLSRLGASPSDLADLVHDVFLVAFAKRERYDPSRPIRPWLFGIAFRVLSEHRSRPVQQAEVGDEALQSLTISPDGDARIHEREARELVIRALQRLSPPKRAVFVLHELDGCAVPEIARALKIPVNTAYSRLRLAREEFTAAVRRLEHQGVER